MSKKPKPAPKTEKGPVTEFQKAVKMQELLEKMQKQVENEYARLDAEFLQLASMVEGTASGELINYSTPVVLEDEATINKKDIDLGIPNFEYIPVNNQVFIPEEEEEDD